MVRYPRTPLDARMISYAQNAEDVMIDRVFQKTAGFFIDVGAFHPVIDSVTKHFSRLGWTGINIEPNAKMFAELAQDRPGEINLDCAVGRQSGEAVFHQISVAQCATISEARFAGYDARLREASHDVTVPVRTLAEICAEHVTGPIDFLKIDAEGAEEDVIRGADWTRFRPRLVVVEATKTGSSEPDWYGWEPYLLSQDYRFQHFDGINRYYLRDEDADLVAQLSVPVNCLDHFLRFGDLLLLRQAERGAAPAQAG